MSGTKRVNRGRGHSYLLDGQKVDGVTTIIGNGMPKPALTAWAAREAATYAADNLQTLANLDREARIDLIKGSPYRDRDKAARRGTEVHSLAERLASGEEVTVPEELVGHVDAYLKFREDWQPAEEIVEFTGANRKHRYMGTGDLICTLDGLGKVLVDVKTTRSGVFGEVALQLAAYRNFEFYLGPRGEELPMPEVEWTGVLWLRADGYDLVPVEAGPEMFRAFLYVQQVARFAESTSRTVVGDALSPQAVG